jgi:hypothetical protein
VYDGVVGNSIFVCLLDAVVIAMRLHLCWIPFFLRAEQAISESRLRQQNIGDFSHTDKS